MDSLWDQQRYRERLDLHYRWSFLWGRGIKIKHFKKENTSSQEINIHARHTHTHTSHTHKHTQTHTHTPASLRFRFCTNQTEQLYVVMK